MKFIKYLIVFLLLVTVYTFADDEFVYRKSIKFGMSLEEVKTHEKDNNDVILITEKEDLLGYKTFMFSHKAFIDYLFWNNHLAGISIILLDNEKDLFSNQYYKILKTLRSKYHYTYKEYLEVRSLYDPFHKILRILKNRKKYKKFNKACKTGSVYEKLSEGCGIITHHLVYDAHVEITLIAGLTKLVVHSNIDISRAPKYIVRVYYRYSPRGVLYFIDPFKQ